MSLVNKKLEARTELWHISPYNFCKEVRSQMNLPKKVQICDLTLREGRQLEGVSLSLDEVLLIAEKLIDAGVTVLQMHHDEPKEMIEIKKRFPSVKIGGLVHPTACLDPVKCKQAVDEIVDHGCDIVDLVFLISAEQMPLYETMAGSRVTLEESIERSVRAVDYAKGKGVTVAFYVNDMMRVDLDLIKNVARQVVDAGASILRFDDTMGQAIYPAYKFIFSEMKKAFPNIPLAFHVHNDSGMAASALYAGLEGGAEILDVSVNGYGERAGIPPLAEVAAIVQIFYGLDAGIKLEKMKDLSEFVADIFKYPVPPKMPCVGDQAHSQLVEVHYVYPPDGYWAWNQWKPEIFGHTTRTMLGQYSGPWSIRSMAKELGITIPEGKVQEVLRRVRSEIRLRKRRLRDAEFRKIVEEVSKGAGKS